MLVYTNENETVVVVNGEVVLDTADLVELVDETPDVELVEEDVEVVEPPTPEQAPYVAPTSDGLEMFRAAKTAARFGGLGLTNE